MGQGDQVRRHPAAVIQAADISRAVSSFPDIIGAASAFDA
jgi:hypothetical protein